MSNNEKEIKSLERNLDDWDNLYHTYGDTGVEDDVYDAAKERLKVLDPTNKRFQQVGAKIKKSKTEKEHWKSFNHDLWKMGSQNKITTEDGLKKFIDTVPDSLYAVEHKLDGTSLKLIYENGNLIVGASRGDGETGDDLTRNALKFQGVPSKINDKRTIIVRGEITLYNSNFHLIGGKNTRNSAAGTAKKLDGVGCEHLTVQVYDIMNWKELGLKTVQEMNDFIVSLGFNLVNTKWCKSVKEIQDYKDQYEKTIRATLDWGIDGLIIKPNTLIVDAWQYPKRSIAYKFASKKAATKLIDVVWRDTGGRFSPTAILEPVDIDGVTVSAATLNNIEHIKKLGIKIGDTVLVSRRNDVIPAIEEVVVSSPTGKDIIPPTHDTEGFPIVHEVNSQGEELVYLVSTNPNSISRKKRQVRAWFNAHDTKGVGDETIESFFENGICKDLPTFYDVGLNGHDDLHTLEGFGAGKFKILNKATLLTSQTTLLKFMDGIDISGFGESRYIKILESIGKETTLDEFIAICSDIDYISKIPSFSDNTAKGLAKGIEGVKEVIKEMVKRVKVDNWHPAKTIASKINGLSFCFTGSMVNDRDILEKSVKAHGGLVAGVSKKLDYLVVSDLSWTSSKVDKANSLGIKKITEDEYLKLINNNI